MVARTENALMAMAYFSQLAGMVIHLISLIVFSLTSLVVAFSFRC